MATTYTHPRDIAGERTCHTQQGALASSSRPRAGLDGSATRYIEIMLGSGDLGEAHERLRALPPSTPELATLMGRLVIAMAHAGMYQDIVKVVPEMLTRFPPGPEITRTLLELALIATSQGRFASTFAAIEGAVARVYGMLSVAEFADLSRRFAHCCRRSGHHGAASNMLHAWHPSLAAA